MQFNQYNDVKAFYRDAYGMLMRHEAQNLILLGNLVIGNAGTDKSGWRDPANWLMATVTDESGIRLTALMTPPYRVTLYATDNLIDDDAIACLIRGIAETRFKVNGVMTEKTLAERFATTFAGTAGKKIIIGKNMRIYELMRVASGIPSAEIRPARESDMAFLPYWMDGFSCDCSIMPSLRQDAEEMRRQINMGSIHILEDGGTPVCMAKKQREIQKVCGVGGVYTPPWFRRKGYATACVAALSRLILSRGFEKCVLYTDLANPTSNSIYQKIGYTPICDSVEIEFE